MGKWGKTFTQVVEGTAAAVGTALLLKWALDRKMISPDEALALRNGGNYTEQTLNTTRRMADNVILKGGQPRSRSAALVSPTVAAASGVPYARNLKKQEEEQLQAELESLVGTGRVSRSSQRMSTTLDGFNSASSDVEMRPISVRPASAVPMNIGASRGTPRLVYSQKSAAQAMPSGNNRQLVPGTVLGARLVQGGPEPIVAKADGGMPNTQPTPSSLYVNTGPKVHRVKIPTSTAPDPIVTGYRNEAMNVAPTPANVSQEQRTTPAPLLPVTTQPGPLGVSREITEAMRSVRGSPAGKPTLQEKQKK